MHYSSIKLRMIFIEYFSKHYLIVISQIPEPMLTNCQLQYEHIITWLCGFWREITSVLP